MSIETLRYIADSPPPEYGGFREDVISVAKWALQEIERLSQWVNDLQSGMYVNCVYCGHRYGPREDTPVAMADVLREHIEQCPQHPLSAAKAQIERLTKTLTQVYAALHKLTAVTSYLDDPAVLLKIPQPHRMKLSELLHGQEMKQVQIDHVYEPFTTRDGSQACRHCGGIPSMHEAAVKTGWLIEARTQVGPVWLVSQCVNGWSWTAESHQALRFCRESDAEMAARIIGVTDFVITEHQWG